jgi:hypothetical protein
LGKFSSVLLKNVAIGTLSEVMLALNTLEQKVDLSQADEIVCQLGSLKKDTIPLCVSVAPIVIGTTHYFYL